MECGQAQRLFWVDNLDSFLSIYLNMCLKTRFSHYALIIYLWLNLWWSTCFSELTLGSLLNTICYHLKSEKELTMGQCFPKCDPQITSMKFTSGVCLKSKFLRPSESEFLEIEPRSLHLKQAFHLHTSLRTSDYKGSPKMPCLLMNMRQFLQNWRMSLCDPLIFLGRDR